MKIFKLVVTTIFLATILIWAVDEGLCYKFDKDEKLTYSARFLYIIPLGNIVMNIGEGVYYEGKRVSLITCEARTTSWISLLFKANAVLNSYVDMKNLYPYKFEQILKVAGKADDIRRATYDRVNNVMEAEGKGKKKVPADVRDPISAIYYLRTQELHEGSAITQMVNNNQSTYIFNSKVSGKKRIGKLDCWALDSKIRRENKSMYHSMDAVIYISDDEKRVPVMIKAKTKVGPVTLRLKEI